MSKWKDAYCVLKAKWSFKNADATENEIPPLFVNQSLYLAYYKFLGSKCKKVIESFWVSKGSCQTRLMDNSVKIIIHIEDLKRLFLGHAILEENGSSL